MCNQRECRSAPAVPSPEIKEASRWIVTLMAIGIVRFMVPTQLDWSPTSVYKDVAHVLFGAACLRVWQLRHEFEGKAIAAVAFVVLAIEVVCAKFGIGGPL